MVIDIRNNNGGFVNVYALDVFTRRNYLTMTPRGERPRRRRTVLGQRALGAPTILVTNQHSLSDAEDFTEGYRALEARQGRRRADGGLDHLHSNVPLIDGTVVRLAGMRVEGADGKTMELVPRQVDIAGEAPESANRTRVATRSSMRRSPSC